MHCKHAPLKIRLYLTTLNLVFFSTICIHSFSLYRTSLQAVVLSCPVFFFSSAWLCASRSASAGPGGPDPEDEGCCAGAGQPAVPQDEEDPLPGETQQSHGRVPGRGGGRREEKKRNKQVNCWSRDRRSSTSKVSTATFSTKHYWSNCWSEGHEFES